jgi:hypothetical protein
MSRVTTLPAPTTDFQPMWTPGQTFQDRPARFTVQIARRIQLVAQIPREVAACDELRFERIVKLARQHFFFCGRRANTSTCREAKPSSAISTYLVKAPQLAVK